MTGRSVGGLRIVRLANFVSPRSGGLRTALRNLGHVLTSTAEIGAVTAIHPLGGGAFEAAAETTRRGGGSAMVVRPAP